jgi:aldose 1-epimerase
MVKPPAAISKFAVALVVVAAVVAVSSLHPEANSKMQKQAFGTLKDGQSVDLYTLTNKHGMKTAITNYGATVVSLEVPDRTGAYADIVLGYEKIGDYENGTSYFGATVGRYANRIGHAKFVLDGVTYTLEKNNGENHLHGGFNKRVWTAKDVSTDTGEALELTYLSPDGEEGYPGNLSVKVVYTLPANQNALKIDYTATTDKPTVLNLSNHSYFNLAGQGNGDIVQHQITLHASRFTPVDSTLIPTGELRDVHNTPFDFLKPFAIGARIDQDDEQLKFGKGYDHNWVLDRKSPASLIVAAVVSDPKSGRVLDVSTTEPGIQFYTGNFLDGTSASKGGKTYGKRSAFCLETQHFPDSPNKPNFPSTVLRPTQTFRSTTIYKFSTK